MDKITWIIIDNNDQISTRIIHEQIIYGLLEQAIWSTKDYLDFPTEARKEINKLFTYSASRLVDVPLVYLIAEKSPTKFGLINVINIENDDRSQNWRENILASGGRDYSVCSYAKVESKGDSHTSTKNATDIVNDMLIFLRAVGFPFTRKSKQGVGKKSLAYLSNWKGNSSRGRVPLVGAKGVPSSPKETSPKPALWCLLHSVQRCRWNDCKDSSESLKD